MPGGSRISLNHLRILALTESHPQLKAALASFFTSHLSGETTHQELARLHQELQQAGDPAAKSCFRKALLDLCLESLSPESRGSIELALGSKFLFYLGLEAEESHLLAQALSKRMATSRVKGMVAEPEAFKTQDYEWLAKVLDLRLSMLPHQGLEPEPQEAFRQLFLHLTARFDREIEMSPIAWKLILAAFNVLMAYEPAWMGATGILSMLHLVHRLGPKAPDLHRSWLKACYFFGIWFKKYPLSKASFFQHLPGKESLEEPLYALLQQSTHFLDLN